MNCKRAKLHIALLIGDDLDEAAQTELRVHLRECPACREYHASMEAAPPPLHSLDDRFRFQPHDSLWPELLEKLPPRPGLRIHDFNGWWAAMSVAVACFAIVLFWNDEARSGRWRGPVAVQSVPTQSAPFVEPDNQLPRVAPVGITQPYQPKADFPPRRRHLMIFIPGDAASPGRWQHAPLLRGWLEEEHAHPSAPSTSTDDPRP